MITQSGGKPRTTSLGILALLVIILLVAAGARFHLLGAQSLWHDEGVSYRLAMRSWSDSAKAVASEVHVPGYFWALNVWLRLTGETEFAMRALSVLCSILSVALTFALGKRLFHPLAGLAAAAFVALNTFSIFYAQELRMYAMMTFLGAASMWFFLDFIKRPRWFPAVAFGLFNLAGWSMHYSYPFLMVSQGIMLLLWVGSLAVQAFKTPGEESVFRRVFQATGKILLQYTVGNLVTIVIFWPWIMEGLFQLSQHPNISPHVPMELLLRTIQGWFAFGMTFEHSVGGMGVAIYFFLLFGLLVLPAPDRSQRAWWFMLLPVVWVAVTVAFYLYLQLYLRYMRQMLPAQIGFALWLGRGVWILWTVKTRERSAPIKYIPRFAAVFAAVGLLVSMAGGLNPLYTDPEFQRDDYRGIVETIQAEMREGDAIIIDAPGQLEVFDYYYTGDIPVYALPASRGDDEKTLADTRQIIADYDRLYALLWGMAEQDPNGIVESTLNNEAYQISDEWVDDIRFVRYVTPAEFTDMEESNTRFGDSITLVAYALSETTIQPGDVVQIRLDWQTDDVLNTRYKVFLQLLDSDGVLVAQRDAEPAGGLAMTTDWEPDTIITDNHALLIPNDLAPAHYTLIMGLYDVNDAQARLPVETGDYLTLAEVEVAPAE